MVEGFLRFAAIAALTVFLASCFVEETKKSSSIADKLLDKDEKRIHDCFKEYREHIEEDKSNTPLERGDIENLYHSTAKACLTYRVEVSADLAQTAYRMRMNRPGAYLFIKGVLADPKKKSRCEEHVQSMLLVCPKRMGPVFGYDWDDDKNKLKPANR